MKDGGEILITLVTSVIGVATLAVIFSTQGKTADVITAFGTQLANVIKVAVAPVSGG
jgi:fructoselysine-6-P-deglycase FrlB-like protein